MTDLVHYEPTDTWVPVLGAVGDLATRLAQTKFVPRSMQGQTASVAAAILTGREMGLGPMASLRGIDVIEGKPALTAQMLAARILAAGHRIEWLESSDAKATVRITRADGLSQAEATWTKADAVTAGLWGKGAWKSYARYMLRHRALTEAAGMACPDVALGLDTADAPEATERPAQPVVAVQMPTPQTATETPVEAAPPATDDTVVAAGAAEPLGQADEPQPDGITAKQLRKIGALIGQLEKIDGQKMTRDERRAVIAAMLGVDHLGSANDLTAQQASQVIDRLQDLINNQPVGEPVADIVDAELVEEEQ